jgi:hypothetical protein
MGVSVAPVISARATDRLLPAHPPCPARDTTSRRGRPPPSRRIVELSTTTAATLLATSFVVGIAVVTGGIVSGQQPEVRLPDRFDAVRPVHPARAPARPPAAATPRHKRPAAAPSPAAAAPTPAAAPSPAAAVPTAAAAASSDEASFAVTPPAAVVTAYYAALDGRRFRAAWRALRPAVQSSFGGFASWRAGFATTLSSRPSEIRVARSGSRAVVTLVLAATDRSPHGLVRRSFDVRWELSASGQGWAGDTLTATERSTRG